jgi:GMP synthase-like glutamine amidotransferase
MGARVYPNLEKEIGWFPIEGLNLEEGKTFCFPTIQKVFHWHGETFDIPQGAYHLARSEACANQAFQIGRSVMGLQFHLESTPETVQEIVSHSRAEIIPSKFVQSESSIIADTFNNYREVNELMIKVLSYLRSSGI